MKREIIYPIFLECSAICDDSFWKNIFEDLAYGVSPYGTYISKGFFCCNYKNKEFSYKIEKKDVKQLQEDVSDLCKKIGILSHNDKIRKTMDFRKFEDDLKDNGAKWCSIRKKNVKDFLIENYVIRMKQKHNLTIKQSKYLNYVIFITLIFKVISIKDIEYSNGEITNIKGISFKDRKIVLEKDIYSFDGAKCIFVDDDKKMMSENWNKFLTQLRKVVS